MGTWGEAVGWSVVVVSSMAYAFKVVLRPQKQGSSKQKLLALLPLLPIFIYLPWLPSSCYIRTLFSIVLLWTAPSKLLLLCFNSPLDPPSWVTSSFSHFLFSTLLPVRVSHAYGNSNSQTKKQQSHSYGYGHAFLSLSLLILILNSYLFLSPLPLPLRYCLYCIHFYLGLELLFNSITSLFSACFSVVLLPSFDHPVLSSSLSELWGRRWNITVNAILRATVYQPVLSVLIGKPHQPHEPESTEQAAKGIKHFPVPIWARAVSTLATFTVSGVMHEIIFVYVSKSEPTGEMAAFFVVNGLATISEMALKKACSGSIKLPRCISVLYTAIFLYLTASFFFLRPLRRSGTDLQAIAEYHQLQDAVVYPFRKMFQSHLNSSGLLNS